MFKAPIAHHSVEEVDHLALAHRRPRSGSSRAKAGLTRLGLEPMSNHTQAALGVRQ